ncbi:MAG: tRNA preQ1(34) S-adenosylmethionine ribosyltransferase-isomerase QueA [Anaerolineales bacterium]|uniref:tRNA preQ1(34) S-adenosylmethionine ribosyltransferase-isomerase QueA n=1 Tax=Candidatus Villigracilis vicinus TaxID=3140679 RepID=UPI003134F3F6|nr:tRNA preQ1(34) S-adenosylmethionine ribosyltransferase-isomerase QueA [Anaerolineales bacterium]
MKTTDFDYHLPETSIGQTPAEPRDSSRLLVLHRDSGEVEHRFFRDVGSLLRPGDLLVLNQTRVIPARIFARKDTGGKVELLLLRRRDDLTWEALVGGKGLRVGKLVHVEDGPTAQIVEILEGSERLIKFSEPIEPYFCAGWECAAAPYIHEKLSDPERYQTVFSKEPGSAAAPTAGLHFTPQLLDALKAAGVKVAYVTLHVGLDTFAPVNEDDPAEHKIHSEWSLSQATADAINQTKRNGGRVIAVGTTSVRTLESAGQSSSSDAQTANSEYQIESFVGATTLFILPGYQFKVVDAMITNFHLPKSTLLMLVSAFAGRERSSETYNLAIQDGYRFYSFGDAMFIE